VTAATALRPIAARLQAMIGTLAHRREPMRITHNTSLLQPRLGTVHARVFQQRQE
jgi:hypothetical protein